MTDCNTELFDFPSFDRRKIEADFSGGDVSSDGGLMLLREADRRLGLCRALSEAIVDPRAPDLITHRQSRSAASAHLRTCGRLRGSQ